MSKAWGVGGLTLWASISAILGTAIAATIFATGKSSIPDLLNEPVDEPNAPVQVSRNEIGAQLRAVDNIFSCSMQQRAAGRSRRIDPCVYDRIMQSAAGSKEPVDCSARPTSEPPKVAVNSRCPELPTALATGTWGPAECRTMFRLRPKNVEFGPSERQGVASPQYAGFVGTIGDQFHEWILMSADEATIAALDTADASTWKFRFAVDTLEIEDGRAQIRRYVRC